MPGPRPAMLALVPTLALLVALVGPALGQRQRGRPPVVSEPASASFGDLRPGQSAETTITVRNTGDDPLTVDRVRTTCRCAVVALDKRRIEPGGSIELTVSIEAPEALGPLTQHAAFIFEGYSVPLQVPLEASVGKGVRITSQPDPPGQGLDAVVTLESTDATPFRVLAVNGAPAHAPDGSPLDEEPRLRHEVRQSIPRGPDGMTPRYFIIETDHPTSPIIDLNVEDPLRPDARPTQRWRIDRERVCLDTITAGQVTSFEVKLLGETAGALDAIEWIESTGDAEVRLLGVERDEPTRSLIARFGVRPLAPARLLDAEVVVTIGGESQAFHVLARVVAAADGAP